MCSNHFCQFWRDIYDYQCNHCSIIVRRHDQGTSMYVLSTCFTKSIGSFDIMKRPLVLVHPPAATCVWRHVWHHIHCDSTERFDSCQKYGFQKQNRHIRCIFVFILKHLFFLWSLVNHLTSTYECKGTSQRFKVAQWVMLREHLLLEYVEGKGLYANGWSRIGPCFPPKTH